MNNPFRGSRVAVTDVVKKKLLRFLPLTFDRMKPEQLTEVGSYAVFPDGFHGTNPSIVPFGDGYLVSVRGVNYVLSGAGMSAVFTAGDRYRTVNRFFLVNREFQLERNLPELDAAFDDVEDIKLFTFEGRIMGSGSCPDPSSGPNACAIGLLTFEASLNGGYRRLIPSPFGFRQEKNWAPFVHQGELHFVYSFEPLVILRYDPATGGVCFADPAFAAVTPGDLKFLIGGSSAGLPFAGGFLFAAHRRRVSLPRMHRTYLSRTYYLDAGRIAMTAGRYFSIGPASIQFINGLAEEEDGFALSYGAFDQRAYLCRVPKAWLLGTLAVRHG